MEEVSNVRKKGRTQAAAGERGQLVRTLKQ